MPKLFIFLVAGMLACGAAFAQGGAGALDANPAAEAFYNKIDTTTEWGQWLVGVFKPYADKMAAEALTTILPATQIDPAGLSQEELLKKVSAGYAEYHKAIQRITPPEELRAYHMKITDVYAEISKNLPAGPEQALELEVKLKILYDEAVQEIIRVLKSHGVPEDVIAEFAQTL
jgi:hypothetical protein